VILEAEDKLWDDIDVGHDTDSFCDKCKITTARAASRGPSRTDNSTWKPGQRVVINIVANPASRCVVPSWHHKYYLALSVMEDTLPAGI
jgi:hypothetical protein